MQSQPRLTNESTKNSQMFSSKGVSSNHGLFEKVIAYIESRKQASCLGFAAVAEKEHLFLISTIVLLRR